MNSRTNQFYQFFHCYYKTHVHTSIFNSNWTLMLVFFFLNLEVSNKTITESCKIQTSYKTMNFIIFMSQYVLVYVDLHVCKYHHFISLYTVEGFFIFSLFLNLIFFFSFPRLKWFIFIAKTLRKIKTYLTNFSKFFIKFFFLTSKFLRLTKYYLWLTRNSLICWLKYLIN